jgi:flavin-binding protein dodecin
VAVVKIIELVGSSKTSTDDAAKQALLEIKPHLQAFRSSDVMSDALPGGSP